MVITAAVLPTDRPTCSVAVPTSSGAGTSGIAAAAAARTDHPVCAPPNIRPAEVVNLFVDWCRKNKKKDQ